MSRKFKDSEVFDIVFALYRRARVVQGRVKTINPGQCAFNGGRPDFSSKVTEFIADFEIHGKKALDAARANRMRRAVWAVYFLGLMDWTPAYRYLRLNESTFNSHQWRIRRIVGRELRATMWPPRRYFEPSIKH